MGRDYNDGPWDRHLEKQKEDFSTYSMNSDQRAYYSIITAFHFTKTCRAHLAIMARIMSAEFSR